MAINRRTLLRGLGPAVAAPYLLRSDPASAAPRLSQISDYGIREELGPGGGGKGKVSLWAMHGLYAAGWIYTSRTDLTDVRAYVQKFSPLGKPYGRPKELGDGGLTDANPAFDISGVALPGGGALVFFSAAPKGSSSESDIFVQRVTRLLEPIGNI